MNFFRSIIQKATKGVRRLSAWAEIGSYRSFFTPFGTEVEKSDLVRACVRTLADQTAKATASVSGSDKASRRLEWMLQYRPNPLMNGKDFLYKVRTQYELYHTSFIVIVRDLMGAIEGLYPMPYKGVEVLSDPEDHLYLRFHLPTGSYVYALEDVIILRKDFNRHDITGDDNRSILETLDLISTSYQGISNAIRSTANLRGIVKSTKSMLDPELQKAQSDRFVRDYLSLENSGGVAYLDATMDFTPITMEPSTTSWTTLRELRENVFRSYGVDDTIILAKATPEQMQVFYELKIEPFLQALSLEMTSKIYTEHEIARGHKVVYQSATVQFMSMKDKLALKDFIDRGALTPNAWAEIVGLPPVEGGDKPIRRLDTAPVAQVAKSIKTDDGGDTHESE